MGGNSIGDGIRINFNLDQGAILQEHTGIKMEGSNTSMSDREGNLLFYSNGCIIVNKEGNIMQNGGGINPGFIGDFYCPVGGSPIVQGVVSIPAPGDEDRYYVFNLDFQTTFFGDTTQLPIAPERIYYQEIDMTLNGGLGAVVAKNQIALQDTRSGTFTGCTPC